MPSADAASSRVIDGDAVLRCVERLQPRPGSYIRIDDLRRASDICILLDEAGIALARNGKLVLARCNGPRPVPEEDKQNYIEDGEDGELHTGVAVPRGKAATRRD